MTQKTQFDRAEAEYKERDKKQREEIARLTEAKRLKRANEKFQEQNPHGSEF